MKHTCSLVLSLSLASSICAQGIQASLTALAPITVSGTAGPTVTHPAGPLTSLTLVGPAGFGHGAFECSVVGTPATQLLTVRTTLPYVFPNTAAVTGDLLLQLSTPAGSPPISLEIEVQHLGDTPYPLGLEVDVGNDGSVDVNAATLVCCGTTRRHDMTADASGAGLAIRVRSSAATIGGPQMYILTLVAREWATVATPVTAACPGTVHTHPTSPIFYTNYQLAAVPAPAPNLCELRAIGLGRFDAFVVSDLPSVLPIAMPAPYAGLCDVLASPLLVVSGVASGAVGFSANPQFTDWSLVVPALPPGLSLHVQHLSATLGSPFLFGATNALRIDT